MGSGYEPDILSTSRRTARAAPRPAVPHRTSHSPPDQPFCPPCSYRWASSTACTDLVAQDIQPQGACPVTSRSAQWMARASFSLDPWGGRWKSPRTRPIFKSCMTRWATSWGLAGAQALTKAFAPLPGEADDGTCYYPETLAGAASAECRFVILCRTSSFMRSTRTFQYFITP
jgi:hypothetical protein